MTRVEINYWLLLRPLLFVNLFVLVLALLGYVFVDPEVMRVFLRVSLPLLGVFVSGVVVLILAINAPPTFIQVDKQAKTVTYARFLRLRTVVLEYRRVRGEFTTRYVSRAGRVRGWALFQGNYELFFVVFTSSGWTEAQLRAVHSQLKPQVKPKSPLTSGLFTFNAHANPRATHAATLPSAARCRQ